MDRRRPIRIDLSHPGTYRSLVWAAGRGTGARRTAAYRLARGSLSDTRWSLGGLYGTGAAPLRTRLHHARPAGPAPGRTLYHARGTRATHARLRSGSRA